MQHDNGCLVTLSSLKGMRASVLLHRLVVCTRAVPPLAHSDPDKLALHEDDVGGFAITAEDWRVRLGVNLSWDSPRLSSQMNRPLV